MTSEPGSNGSDERTRELEQATVFDFVEDYLDDLEQGRLRELTYYLARYPGHEEAIAREFLELRAGSPARKEEPETDVQRVGPYRLIEEIGRGGQGTVHLAEDTRIARRVALKLLGGIFVSDERRARFRREAEVVSRLRHPGVCGVLDADVDGEVPYIAMPFVEGRALSALLKSGREGTADPASIPLRPQSRTDLHQLLYVFERAARALHAAHEVGVVHRDVKPGNILVTTEGEPVLVDFGLAHDDRADAEGLTMVGEVFGTLDYMSPEQLSGDQGELDRRTDVYSLGATLHQTLTLAPPFHGKNRIELERAILFDPPPDPRTSGAKVPEDLKVVLETALAKERGRRYATALDFAEDLRRIREYEPIRAAPAGAWLRMRRWVRRQPTLAAALLVTLGSLIAGLVLTLTLLARETRARKHAVGRQLAVRAGEMVGEDPARALALGIWAVDWAPGYDTRSALFGPLEACLLDRVLDAPSGVHRIWDVALDRDGELLVGALDDGQVRAWNVPDGSVVWDAQGDGSAVRRVALDPRGSAVAAGTEDGRVLLFDVETRVESWRLELAGGPVLWVEFDPSGERVVAQPAEGHAAIVAVQDGSVLARLATEPLTSGCATFAPDGGRVLTASRGWSGLPETGSPRATVWDARSGQVEFVLEGHTAPVMWAGYAPRGGTIATACAAGRVQLWDAETGAQRGAPIEVGGRATHAAFDSDAQRLAIARDAGEEPGALVIDLASGARLPLESHGESAVLHVAFSPDGNRVATASRDASARLFDARTGCVERVSNGVALPLANLFLEGGRRVITHSNSRRLHVWRAGEPPFAYRLRGHVGAVRWAGFAPDGTRAVTVGDDGQVLVFATPRGTEGSYAPGERIATLAGHAARVNGAAFDPSGVLLLTYGDDRTVRVWDSSGQKSYAPLAHDSPVVAAEWSPVDERIATVEESGRARLFDLAAGNSVTLEGERLARARFSRAGRWLATAGDDGTVRLCDPETGATLREIRCDPNDLGDLGSLGDVDFEGTNDLDFSPDDARIALSGADERVYFIDPELGKVSGDPRRLFKHRRVRYDDQGRRLLLSGTRLRGHIRLYDMELSGPDETRLEAYIPLKIVHRGGLTSSSFSPTGEYVAAGTREDAVIVVWEAATGLPVVIHGTHTGAITTVSFSPVPDDVRVIAASEDGTASVWPVDPTGPARERQPRELSRLERTQEERLAAPPEH